ncbi:MAG: cryptochrome/photolyase family protein [Candidatus Methylacidiphilales bacterium]|nr:cryptochrome/photolyase family protein [Candidatus Methylacidiphilales bacterium]
MDAYWILGDQLQHDHPALKLARPDDLFVFIESKARGGHLRYHTHKLVLIYSAMRHLAAEWKKSGRKVCYHALGEGPSSDYLGAWKEILARHHLQAIHVMEPSEWTMDQALAPLARKLGLPIHRIPTNQFLTKRSDFAAWAGGRKHLLMADHYRRQRERLGILLDQDGGPEGGSWSFDADNRETFGAFDKSAPPVPPLPAIRPDAVTRTVMEQVAAHFPGHPGDPATFWLPVTRRESLAWLDDFIQRRLSSFGPFEDTMASGQPHLFHSVLTPMLNTGLLRPMECIERAVAAWRSGKAPIASVEGFVRQIVGWREFINGVYWLHMPGYASNNALEASRPLPDWLEKGQSPMNCVGECVNQARATGYNHHIQRLMVLGNFFLLGGYDPQAVLRWYMEMYVDAYDWVMQPNVLGMVLYADGGRFATKPYAAGSGYIQRMSDYCRNCRFDPKLRSGPKACPFNILYWNFFDRHETRFASNPRVAMIVNTLRKKSAAERKAIRTEAASILNGWNITESTPADRLQKLDRNRKRT